MGDYRELFYGAMLFATACVGAVVAAWFGYVIGGIDIEELALESAVKAAPLGAGMGCVAWLVFRYTCLRNPRT
jgi:hypothetical protein